MRYRPFGKLDWNVSALGFGCMRLPTTDGNPFGSEIDEVQAVQAIRLAIDAGVNYIDTAYPYHNGKSEVVVAKALANGYRSKVRLATKSPTWLITGPADFDRYLDEQLRRLQTSSIDFYLLHSLNRTWWREVILKHGVLRRAEAALKDGRIRSLGFSFHDSADAFTEILDGYDGWSFCQIQYNYMNTETQAGVKGLRQAAAKGLGVVVMEPLLGGRLARPPAAIRDLFEKGPRPHSAADLALQWIWDQPEVSVVLSGMNSLEQVQQNLASAERAQPGSLSPAERELIAGAQRIYQEQTRIPCTRCGYCLPCPNEVNIPVCFEIYNDAFFHEDVPGAALWYQLYLNDGARGRSASACVACHDCEDRCPQQIPIADWMPKVHALLSSKSA